MENSVCALFYYRIVLCVRLKNKYRLILEEKMIIVVVNIYRVVSMCVY